MILTSRDPTRLNDLLRFPRQAMSAWHLIDEAGRLRGFAVLNLIPQDDGRTRTGKKKTAKKSRKKGTAHPSAS